MRKENKEASVRFPRQKDRNMIIAAALRDLVETHVRLGRPLEVGGVFLGEAERLMFFVPLPNIAQDKNREYLTHIDHLRVADLIAKMSGLQIIAGMHSHPNGTVVSEADLRWLRGTQHQYGVVVADKGQEMEWFCLNKDGVNQPVMWSEEQHEMVALLLARKIGLTDLGRVMLTPKGEVLSENPEARTLLSLDEDAWKVRSVLYGLEKWRWPTKTEIAKLSGISVDRVRKVMKRMK